MAVNFIVEDGTGKSTATSYITVEELDQFFEDNGFDEMSETETIKQQYINRCTTYIDRNYTYQGFRKLTTQSLQWPRQGAFYNDNGWSTSISSDVIPQDLKNAVCLLVYYVSSGAVTLTQYDDGKQISSYSVNVGGAIQESTSYFGPDTNNFNITEIEYILKRIISSNGKSKGVNSLIRGCEGY